MATPWYCTVCGADAPDFVPSMGRTNRRNDTGRDVGVVALPCGHEQSDGLACRSEEEQRAHLIVTSPAPTGTKAYLGALANQRDRRRSRPLRPPSEYPIKETQPHE